MDEHRVNIKKVSMGDIAPKQKDPLPQKEITPQEEQKPAVPTPGGQNKSQKKRWWVIVVIIAMVVGLFSVFVYKMVHKEGASSNAEKEQLLEEVGKLVILPTDEEPVVATVTDASKLREQPFFERAIEGDKLLVYSKAKKVILYRPSEGKIIDIGPIEDREDR